jgi:hypothetical protein
MGTARDIWVDFNGVRANNRVSTLATYATTPDLIVGATLIAGDDQGNRCEATVISVERSGIVVLALDQGTFQTVSSSGSLATA